MSELRVVFFASLKEAIGQSGLSLSLPLPMTIHELKTHLANTLNHGQLLLEPNVQSSIDFEFARDADLVSETSQEVAFFPPVTGG